MISKNNISTYLSKNLNINPNEIINIILISAGMVNLVFKVELKNSQSIIVKQFLSKPKLNRFSSFELPTTDRLNASVDSQSLIYEQYPELVSKILHIDSENCVLVETAFENTYSLHTLFEQHKLTPKIIKNLASSLKKLHSVDFTDLNPGMNLVFLDLKLQNKYLGYDFLEENLQELLKNTANNYLQIRSSLVHGDMVSTNILIDNKNQYTYLIDFEGAHIGNPEFDLGYIVAELILYDLSNPNKNLKKLSEIFIDSYGFENRPLENLSIHMACLILYLLKGRGGNQIKHLSQDNNARIQAYDLAMELLNNPNQNILTTITK